DEPDACGDNRRIEWPGTLDPAAVAMRNLAGEHAEDEQGKVEGNVELIWDRERSAFEDGERDTAEYEKMSAAHDDRQKREGQVRQKLDADRPRRAVPGQAWAIEVPPSVDEEHVENKCKWRIDLAPRHRGHAPIEDQSGGNHQQQDMERVDAGNPVPHE